MNVVFRTDASTALGSGHVMRCLTLAEELRSHGADVAFVCRTHDGHMSDLIADRGFIVFRLAAADPEARRGAVVATSWQEDAAQTQAALQTAGVTPDWPVSYTHLDVYKRQGEIQAAIEKVCASQHFILGPQVRELETKIAEYSQCRHGIGAVSYTHLLLPALDVHGAQFTHSGS